jgi:hypothetical protein
VKRCPTCGQPATLRRRALRPVDDIFQCAGDRTRPVGDQFHRFLRDAGVESSDVVNLDALDQDWLRRKPS